MADYPRSTLLASEEALQEVETVNVGRPIAVETSSSLRLQALKEAEAMVSKLAPSTNARGYSDNGVAPLRDRVDAILRLADYIFPTQPEEGRE